MQLTHTKTIFLTFPSKTKHPINCIFIIEEKRKEKMAMRLVINMDQMPKMSFLMLLFCILISFNTNYNTTHKTTITTPSSSSSSSHSRSVPLDSFSSYPVLLSVKNHDHDHDISDHGDGDGGEGGDDIDDGDDSSETLQYDYYRSSCPHAERIVRSTIHRLYHATPSLVPAIIRLAFHDCFVQGCDASVLLDDDDYIDSEKESPPNVSLKGFDVIETIKSKLEEACPGVVSCADILVLAARDCVVLAGGPFYPLNTGRRDGLNSYPDMATLELPSPYADLSKTLASFKAKGFTEKEIVSLLGAHSIGEIHCTFFRNRLYNFTGTNEPDPSLETEFLDLLRSRCSNTHESSSSGLGYNSHNSLSSPSSESSPLDGLPSSSVDEPGINMDMEDPGIAKDLEQPRPEFGMKYYRSLLQGRGILFADQQLMEGEGTSSWVKTYALDPTLFQKDFALAMMKLSDLQVLTPPMGQIRLNCSRVL